LPADAASSPPVVREGLLARLGQVSTQSPRFFWCLGHSRSDFEFAADMIDALMARHPRVDFLFTTEEPETRTWLRRRFPRGLVLPPPFAFTPICARFIANLNVRGIAILGRLASGDRAVLRAANGRALPAVTVETPDAGAAASVADLGVVPERPEHHFLLSNDTENRLRQAGVAAERITRLPADSAARCERFASLVSHLLSLDLKLIRSEQRPIRRTIELFGLRCMGDPRLRRLVAAKARRYDTLEDLRAALGSPETILCLGNGPSSEDPAVADVAHDCLFRVNDLWLKRGLLVQPDMVFTGSKGTLALVKGAIFGLHTVKSEARLLASPLFRLTRWGFRYATIERFGLFLSEPRWDDMRPTNGAVMLATAVALQPARLVISGIDLFSHPAGTYPGDTRTPNAYTPGHNAESELALLLEALSRYRGELTILSPALLERWQKYCDARNPRPDHPPDRRPERHPDRRLGDTG